MVVDEATALILGHGDRRVVNGLITWRYHELALALAERLGGLASWFAFGTWASRSAGRVIRGEQFGDASGGGTADEENAVAAAAAAPAAVALRRRVQPLARPLGPPRAAPVTGAIILGRYVDGVRRRMADLVWTGNRMVFVDLGPSFTALCRTFAPGQRPRAAEIERFLAAQGPSVPPCGRDRSLALLCRALASDDERERAQLVAVSALEAVRYEQVRLDRYVDLALQAPAGEMERLLTGAVGECLPGWLRPLARILAVGLVRPVLTATTPLVEEVTTRRLVAWSLGDRLQVPVSTDLTPPEPGRPFLPPSLEPPRIAELTAFLAQAGTDLGGSGTAVRRWGDLDQRMRFITNLFCSRFAVPELLQPPFRADQVEQLRRGELPPDLP